MSLEFTDEERERYFSVMAAGGIADKDELSTYAHLAVLTLARQDDNVFRALRELMTAARGAGYREACLDLTRHREGVVYVPDDAAAPVTTTGLAATGITDRGVVGVRWGPGEDMCVEHALAYAKRQHAAGSDERGVLLYESDQLGCFVCRMTTGSEAS